MLLVTAVVLGAVVAEGRVYSRCELAEELVGKYKVTRDKVATWVCIAERESSLNTSALGRLNGDGSSDHGLFQVSDKYWCSPGGWACGLPCSSLRDDDLSDDWKCVKRIYKEHQHLSGDGFTAWAVYLPHCKGGSVQDYVADCFRTTTGTEPAEEPTTLDQTLTTLPQTTLPQTTLTTSAQTTLSTSARTKTTPAQTKTTLAQTTAALQTTPRPPSIFQPVPLLPHPNSLDSRFLLRPVVYPYVPYNNPLLAPPFYYTPQYFVPSSPFLLPRSSPYLAPVYYYKR